MFFFPFLFSGYCHSVGVRVVSVVSGGCNQSSFVLFYVVLESLYRYVNAVFNAVKSSSSFSIVFFLFHLFDGFQLLISPKCISTLPFLRANLISSFDLVVPFHSSNIVCRFSLLAWCIFLCQMPSLYPDSIFSMRVSKFQILFHFFQTVWCLPFTFVDWSFPAIF